MPKITSLFLAFIFSVAIVYSQTHIRNVTIVDVVNKKLVPGQSVLIENGQIFSIASVKKSKAPANATVIDGTGKYLMPGMTDAHVHFFQSGGLYTRPDVIDQRKQVPYETEIAWTHANMEDFLRRYLRAGITTVFDVGSTYNFLKRRDSLANAPFAPKVYMTGPLLTSREPAAYRNLKNDAPFRLVTSVEDARRGLEEQLPFKPDLVKIWYIVNPDSLELTARRFSPVIKEVIETAHKNNLKVAVHATQRITAQLAVENGCDFLVHHIEDEPVTDEFVQLLKAKKTVLCPTLTVGSGYSNTFGQRTNYSSYELKNANPQQIGSVFDVKHLPESALFKRYRQMFGSTERLARIAQADSIRKLNLKKLADGGVTIVAGTDAGNIGTQHASSYLAELKAMQASGLTNWQILQTATVNPAKILDQKKTTGSVSVGKTADLVLLDANPVDGLENLSKISLVFNRGKVIRPDTLIKETPLALVQRQLNAYNARNIDAFLEPYADDVELYTFPDKLTAKGKAAMRERYAGFFEKTPELHCEIKGRIMQGNVVIDKEHITGIGNRSIEATAIYHIESNKIARVYFVR